MFQTPTKKKVSPSMLYDCLEDPATATARSPREASAVPRADGTPVETVCAVITNVMTPSECTAMIERAEQKGFAPALLNIGGGQEILAAEVRHSDRVIVDDLAFAKALYARIQPILLPVLAASPLSGLEMAGLNERMRILRYQPGHVFQPHRDGCYPRPDGSETSLLTVMIYLNQGFSGGSTVFHDSDCTAPLGGGTTTPGFVEVVPRTGSVLVFAHELLHEGQRVEQGTKYAIRTDIMFKN